MKKSVPWNEKIAPWSYQNLNQSPFLDGRTVLESAKKPTGRFSFDRNREISKKIKRAVVEKLFQAHSSLVGGEFLTTDEAFYELPLQWRYLFEELRNLNISPVPRTSLTRFFSDECPVPTVLSTCSFEETGSVGRDPGEGAENKDEYFLWGYGIDLDPELAIAKSLGEFVERISLLQHNKPLFAPAIDLQRKNDIISPGQLSVFSEKEQERHKNRCFSGQSIFGWVRGKNLSTGRSTMLPAQRVFWNYNRPEHEPFLGEFNTNGAAGSFTTEEAILGGLYELIERDSFLIFWLNKITPSRINLKSIHDAQVQQLCDILREYNFNIEILDISTDTGAPVFLAGIFDNSGIGPAISFGAASDLSSEKAIQHALLEAVLMYHVTRMKMVIGVDKPTQAIDFDDVMQADRGLIYADSDTAKKLDWMFNGAIVDLKSIKERYPKHSTSESQLNYLRQHFKRLGNEYDISYYQATHPLAKALSFVVVQVVVPALVPLYLSERFKGTNFNRLHEVPRKLGYKNSKFPNQFPHPFI